MASRKKNAVDKAVSALYGMYFNCISVDVMDICAIYREIKDVLYGAAPDAGVAAIGPAMNAIVAKYRKS